MRALDWWERKADWEEGKWFMLCEIDLSRRLVYHSGED